MFVVLKVNIRSYSGVPLTLRLERSVVMAKSRIAGLLLLLVCCPSPSNADLIHTLDAAEHPVVPATTGFIPGFAGAKKPENKLSHAASGADHDDRKSDNTADDDDAAVRQQVFGNENRESDMPGKVSLQASEKRRWSALNSKAAWGKRDEFDDENELDWRPRDLTARNQRLQEAAAEKRRWSANNGMRAWGKRLRPYLDGRSKRSVGDYEQRRWVPVKRQLRHTSSRYGGPKRTWEYNTMQAWGKRHGNQPRDHLDHLDERIWPKRSWSSDNSLRIWG